jgi:hypothetical protein
MILFHLTNSGVEHFSTAEEFRFHADVSVDDISDFSKVQIEERAAKSMPRICEQRFDRPIHAYDFIAKFMYTRDERQLHFDRDHFHAKGFDHLLGSMNRRLIRRYNQIETWLSA